MEHGEGCTKGRCVCPPEVRKARRDARPPPPPLTAAERGQFPVLGEIHGFEGDTKSARFAVVNKKGVHMRPARKLVELAASFPCDVMLVGREGVLVNAKSIFEVLYWTPRTGRPNFNREALAGTKGVTLEFRATGERAEECLAAIGRLVASGFGESP